MIHDQDLVCIDDGVEPVGNNNDCAGGEFLIDGVLNEGVSVCVYRCGRLVQADHLWTKFA